jgi:hypothetical protein
MKRRKEIKQKKFVLWDHLKINHKPHEREKKEYRSCREIYIPATKTVHTLDPIYLPTHKDPGIKKKCRRYLECLQKIPFLPLVHLDPFLVAVGYFLCSGAKIQPSCFLLG